MFSSTAVLNVMIILRCNNGSYISLLASLFKSTCPFEIAGIPVYLGLIRILRDHYPGDVHRVHLVNGQFQNIVL
jgi:hypothetical protein